MIKGHVYRDIWSNFKCTAVATIVMVKEAEKGLWAGTRGCSKVWRLNVYSSKYLYIKRHRLNKSQGTGL